MSAMCGGEVSAFKALRRQEAMRGPFLESVHGKLVQFRDPRTMGCLPRRAADGQWTSPRETNVLQASELEK